MDDEEDTKIARREWYERRVDEQDRRDVRQWAWENVWSSGVVMDHGSAEQQALRLVRFVETGKFDTD